jgi:hypothetical protein
MADHPKHAKEPLGPAKEGISHQQIGYQLTVYTTWQVNNNNNNSFPLLYRTCHSLEF